jgi:hypothetical protein
MRKTIQSGLVVILTVISVFAMITYRSNVDPEETVFIEDQQEEETIKPEGTGFMFDDFDKGINIPVEVDKESRIDKETITEEEKAITSGVDKKRFMRMFEAAMSRLEEDIAFAGITYKPRVAVEAARDVRSESKVIISKVQSNITMEDKLSLIKIVKNLNINELASLKKAMENGTTDEESIKLWTMLKYKLDEEDYRTLEKIIAKYE